MKCQEDAIHIPPCLHCVTALPLPDEQSRRPCWDNDVCSCHWFFDMRILTISHSNFCLRRFLLCPLVESSNFGSQDFQTSKTHTCGNVKYISPSVSWAMTEAGDPYVLCAIHSINKCHWFRVYYDIRRTVPIIAQMISELLSALCFLKAILLGIGNTSVRHTMGYDQCALSSSHQQR